MLRCLFNHFTIHFYIDTFVITTHGFIKKTQEQLGELIGVKKAQICKIENGGNITFRTIAKVFQAMGISAKLDLAGVGQVALW